MLTLVGNTPAGSQSELQSLNHIPMPTEASTTDRPTTSRNLAIRFQLFPTNTYMVGPVAILQAVKPRAMVFLSNKLIFPDKTEVVIAVETRPLWQGADGAAFDAIPGRAWRIAASFRNGIIVGAMRPQ